MQCGSACVPACAHHAQDHRTNNALSYYSPAHAATCSCSQGQVQKTRPCKKARMFPIETTRLGSRIKSGLQQKESGADQFTRNFRTRTEPAGDLTPIVIPGQPKEVGLTCSWRM